MTATHAARQQLVDYIQNAPDERVWELAHALLPNFAPEPEQLREPLMFTKEESESRLLIGLAQLEAGEGIPLEEFLRRRQEKRAARVSS